MSEETFEVTESELEDLVIDSQGYTDNGVLEDFLESKTPIQPPENMKRIVIAEGVVKEINIQEKPKKYIHIEMSEVEGYFNSKVAIAISAKQKVKLILEVTDD